ncbi:MAG: 4'-phosphopantetheinyl transferase family protein, partial [Candidatus Krumholzibacteriia bacterium]
QRPLPVTISISHSGGVGFCVFAERDVGCDAELVEPRSHAFIRDYFRPEERRAVFLAPAAYRPLLATLTWSAKESVLKVLHAGLRRDTRTVAVDVPRVRGGRGPAWSRFSARCTDGPERFDGWWRTSGRHLLTVTVRAPQGVEL